MVSVILSIDEHIVMYGQYSGALGHNVIHPHLEDILGTFSVWREHVRICTFRDGYWTLSGVMLPRLGASQRRPCCRWPLKTWWLPWEHGLSPRGLVLCGSHGWWPCLGPWGQGKSSACHLPSLDTLGCWPMVWAQSVWRWSSDGPSLLTPSQSPPCTRWAPSVLLCWTGRTVGSILMSYSPCMSPMQLKLLGYRAWRSLVLSMVTDPGSM